MALTKITSRILDSSGVTILGTISTGVWQGTAINQTYLVGQSGTNTGDETLARINALDITELGTVSSGVWNGTAIASAYLDADTAHLSTTQTFTGSKTFSSGGIFSSSSSQGKLKLVAGSNEYLSLEFANASGTTQWEISKNNTHDLYFYKGGYKMILKSDGNVGIGTTAPEGKLTINYTAANLPTSGTTSNSAIQILSSLNNQLNIGLNVAPGYGSYIQASDNNLAVPYSLNLQPSGGNVGIGTTAPVKMLDVQGQLAISNNASSYWYLDRNDSSGNFDIINDSNQVKLTISSGGAIGQSVTPISDPYVAGAEQWMTYQIGKGGIIGAYKNNNESMFGFNTYVSAPSGLNKAVISGINGTAIRCYADRITFNHLTSSGTSQTQSTKLTISSGGNVGIGTDSPSGKLHIASSGGADGLRLNAGTSSSNFAIIANNQADNATLFYVKGDGDAFFTGDVLIGTTTVTSVSKLQLTSSNAFYGFVDRALVSNIGNPAGFFNSAGANVGGIATNNTSTTYATSSDYRLKENVTPITDALSRLNQLKPSRFNFIGYADNAVDGFIAHEVQDIVPEAISGEKDALNEDGTPDYQGIDQSKIVPLLTAAIKEQQTIIEDLKSRIETLEG